MSKNSLVNTWARRERRKIRESQHNWIACLLGHFIHSSNCSRSISQQQQDPAGFFSCAVRSPFASQNHQQAGRSSCCHSSVLPSFSSSSINLFAHSTKTHFLVRNLSTKWPTKWPMMGKAFFARWHRSIRPFGQQLLS